MVFHKNVKRNLKLIAGTAAGGTLGFITGNVPGAILGAGFSYSAIKKADEIKEQRLIKKYTNS